MLQLSPFISESGSASRLTHSSRQEVGDCAYNSLLCAILRNPEGNDQLHLYGAVGGGSLELSEFGVKLTKLLFSQKGQGKNINLRLCLRNLFSKPQILLLWPCLTKLWPSEGSS